MKNKAVEANNIAKTALKSFEKKFGKGEEPAIILSPASLIFLGDHTHYNDGILLSCALDCYTVITIRKREDAEKNLHFSEESTTKEFCLNSKDNQLIPYKIASNIAEFVYERYGLTSGFDCIFYSNIPQGVGLGGISSLSIGFINALDKIFNLKIEPVEKNNIARQSEKKYLGKISNKANHFTVANAEAGKITFVDLRKQSFENFKFDGKDYKIVICDTGIKIKNSADLCNERIEECEIGVKGLRLYIWGIKNLRDVNESFLFQHRHMLPKIVYERIHFNVQERIRVENALKAVKKNDKKTFSEQIYNSHKGLSENYNISSKELDHLVEESEKIEGVLASKMISCSPIRSTFHLIEKDKVEQFREQIYNKFSKTFRNRLNIYDFNFSSGVKRLQ